MQQPAKTVLADLYQLHGRMPSVHFETFSLNERTRVRCTLTCPSLQQGSCSFPEGVFQGEARCKALAERAASEKALQALMQAGVGRIHPHLAPAGHALSTQRASHVLQSLIVFSAQLEVHALQRQYTRKARQQAAERAGAEREATASSGDPRELLRAALSERSALQREMQDRASSRRLMRDLMQQMEQRQRH